jgi:hypothetical protein
MARIHLKPVLTDRPTSTTDDMDVFFYKKKKALDLLTEFFTIAA